MVLLVLAFGVFSQSIGYMSIAQASNGGRAWPCVERYWFTNDFRNVSPLVMPPQPLQVKSQFRMLGLVNLAVGSMDLTML
ncbi:MAG: hypothetical protein FJ319_14620 [SAR202 cluster bacterium]|nr:hypothetical protein [SAR202 cluster bacterium]